ncbi:unnamed protein product [Haemonchus placei]|uniref:Fibronectin type-III domain-containing protein n=1 Tax=Haemonchus placei TaxID=6290 RepID=A0A0N4WEY5_HAEPC|nr:unnamed protein product [Haemonchus placei]
MEDRTEPYLYITATGDWQHKILKNRIQEPGTSPPDSQKPGTSSSDSQKPGTASSDSQKSNDAMENKGIALNDEDEFLAKLNEVRRRSLVNMKDVRENQRVRQPSEITEESEEDPNNNSTSSKKLLSRSSTSESGHTFRVTSEPEVSLPPINVPTPVPRMSLIEATPTGSPARKTAEEPNDSAPFTTGTSQHDAWLRKKIEEARKKKQREREAAKKKEEEEKERREQAKKLFERWKSERDEKLREERRRQRAKEKEKRQAEEERKKEKKLEAEKTFQAWKRSHSATRRTGLSDAEKEKQRQKEEARKEAEKAFETWKRNKDAAEQAERRKAAERELAEKKRLEEEREYRELLARQTYETWLEIKENERMMAQSLASLGFEEPEPLPWLPPSNTCPRRFTPTLRNRSSSPSGRSHPAKAISPADRVKAAITESDQVFITTIEEEYVVKAGEWIKLDCRSAKYDESDTTTKGFFEMHSIPFQVPVFEPTVIYKTIIGGLCGDCLRVLFGPFPECSERNDIAFKIRLTNTKDGSSLEKVFYPDEWYSCSYMHSPIQCEAKEKCIAVNFGSIEKYVKYRLTLGYVLVNNMTEKELIVRHDTFFGKPYPPSIFTIRSDIENAIDISWESTYRDFEHFIVYLTSGEEEKHEGEFITTTPYFFRNGLLPTKNYTIYLIAYAARVTVTIEQVLRWYGGPQIPMLHFKIPVNLDRISEKKPHSN